METQEQWKKEEQESNSETTNDIDRQVRETIDQFLKAISEKGGTSYLPEVWTLAADILRIEIIHKLKTEEMTSIT